MARLFTGASSEIARNTTGAPVTAVPLTIAGWVRAASNAAAEQCLCEVKDKDTTNSTGERQGWRVALDASERVIARTSTAASGTPSTGGAVTVGVWAHAGGVFAADNSRIAYLNGTAATENTTSYTPAGPDSVALGASTYSGTSIAAPFDGDLAEWGIWNVALTANEMASLAKGISPLLIRPANLVFYAPLMGTNSPEIDVVGLYNLTLTGTSKSAHPRIFRPTAKILTFPSASAGSLNVSATTDALTLAEYAATIGKSINVSANVDALTLAEYAATVSLARDVSATVDALTLAEYSATIGKSLNISATTDALTLAEYAASVGSVTDIAATTDALTLAEYAATIGLSKNVQAGTDALTLAEYPASLGSTQNVQATTDALTLAEYAATVSFALDIPATTDALTLTEYRATIGDGAITPAVTPAGGGRSKKRRRVMVNGRLYNVTNDELQALLAKLKDDAATQAAVAEALGDEALASEIKRKVIRLAKRVEKVDERAEKLRLLRNEDEQILSLFIDLLAA